MSKILVKSELSQSMFKLGIDRDKASRNWRRLVGLWRFGLTRDCVASIRSCSCSKVVALAMGAVMLGRAISHARETFAGVESYCRAT